MGNRKMGLKLLVVLSCLFILQVSVEGKIPDELSGTTLYTGNNTESVYFHFKNIYGLNITYRNEVFYQWDVKDVTPFIDETTVWQIRSTKNVACADNSHLCFLIRCLRFRPVNYEGYEIIYLNPANSAGERFVVTNTTTQTCDLNSMVNNTDRIFIFPEPDDARVIFQKKLSPGPRCSPIEQDLFNQRLKNVSTELEGTWYVANSNETLTFIGYNVMGLSVTINQLEFSEWKVVQIFNLTYSDRKAYRILLRSENMTNEMYVVRCMELDRIGSGNFVVYFFNDKQSWANNQRLSLIKPSLKAFEDPKSSICDENAMFEEMPQGEPIMIKRNKGETSSAVGNNGSLMLSLFLAAITLAIHKR